MAGTRQTRSRRVNQVDDLPRTVDGNSHGEREEFRPQFNAPTAAATAVPLNVAETAQIVTPIVEGPAPTLLEDLLQLVRKQ